MRAAAHALFFFSGAAALVYEVVWARSLTLVFGASHLAVSTVLAVYMGGQALGSRLLAGAADRTARPLRLYGLLEVGIATSALGFLALGPVYPTLYAGLAGAIQDRGALVTAVRTLLAAAAMVVPTTLMGGTLPVMARAFAARGGGLAREVSRLYALNTLGAVAGTLAAGFVLLPSLGATATLLAAVATSALVGAVALALGRSPAGSSRPPPGSPMAVPALAEVPGAAAAEAGRSPDPFVRRMILLGIGVSGFCALGYEVLWTRMLTLVVGTSVYSFAIMLAAFLTGIGLGSHAYGLLDGRLGRGGDRGRAAAFGAIQVAVGASALAVTVLMTALPSTVQTLQASLVGLSESEFRGRLGASAAIAFAYMAVPAFFMGMAFPAAAAVWGAGARAPAGTVGRLLASNTLGAVLGPLLSGFALVGAFGIERALQMLVVANVAAGVAVAVSPASRRWPLAVAAAAAALLVARGALPDWGRAWDRTRFATFVNNARMGTPDPGDVEVLYFREGVNETVSVTRSIGGDQTYVVNGRPEASTAPVDVQLQRSLGHLPMLLHPDPKRAFVLGTGTGMTLGAIARHPGVERLVLAEIEAEMIPVGRTFARWNGGVLDDPRLRVALDDGRTLLAVTSERFDVVSADPIHPWSGGAGYLYTLEFFRAVSARLAPRGIASQWLPLYELTERDVRTVVRTFCQAFPHVAVFLTYYDAVLLGSNDPLVLDRDALAARLAAPSIRDDLAPLSMGSADDLLDHFVMGTAGARAFGQGGDLNTDDNLVLEFSAPRSQGALGNDARNVLALGASRESGAPYAADPGPPPPAERDRWDRRLELGRLFDPAHARFLLGDPSAEPLLDALEARAPSYAPLRFVREERRFRARTEPAPVGHQDFPVAGRGGEIATLRISAVRQYLGRERVLVSLVDNARREIYGQRHLTGPYEDLDAVVGAWVGETFAALRRAAAGVPAGPGGVPDRARLSGALRAEAARAVGRPR
jgi:spermidine synthase